MYTNPVPCPPLPVSQRRIMFTKQAKGLSITDYFDLLFIHRQQQRLLGSNQVRISCLFFFQLKQGLKLDLSVYICSVFR